jgi:hypothetical protein
MSLLKVTVAKIKPQLLLKLESYKSLGRKSQAYKHANCVGQKQLITDDYNGEL